MNRSEDVFIIGGGPAGLAAAIALSQKGLCVTVADGAEMPIDKVCGEGILPLGVSILGELGVQVPHEHSFPLAGLRFLCRDESAQAEFPLARGLGVRRVILHRAMMDAAQRAGVLLARRSPVGLAAHGSLMWQGRAHRPRWIVAADGAFSRTRRWAGLQSHNLRRKRFAFRRHYQVAPWSDFVEVYWGRRGQFYVTPLSDTEVGVVLLATDPHLRIDPALGDFPALANRLRHARAATRERAGVTGSWIHRRVVHENTLLVGDAAGLVDAISGEGLRLAFRQSQALADAVSSGDLARYQRRHHRMMRRPRFMARLLLAMQRRPGLQQRVIRLLARKPALFQRLLSVHAGCSPQSRLPAIAAGSAWKLFDEA